MANSSFNLHEPKTDLTVTTGSVNFTIRSYYAYREGRRVHAEVYGDIKVDTSSGSTFPYFTVNGIQRPSSDIKVGTMILMNSSANPIYVIPGLAYLQTNGYFTQKAAANLTANQRLGFIVDYIEDF